tara:strand:+ start:2196 stop:2828 length:633 start_codon:yes stop_codon:yes gene_type:complete
MKPPEIIPLFSQPLYINHITDDEFSAVSNAIIDTPCPSLNTYEGNGYMSEDTIWLENNIAVKNVVDRYVEDYVHKQLAISKRHYLEHSTSWVNLHKPNDTAQTHTHSNSMFSGVLYAKCDKDTGPIRFTFPSMIPTFTSYQIELDLDDNNFYNMREAIIYPDPKMILVFPSHLPHDVGPNLSTTDRYSMAFNYFMKGPFGNDAESRLLLK